MAGKRGHAISFAIGTASMSLNKDSPASRAIEPFGRIQPVPILGGLHHQYIRI
jgi:hypothetical protein